MQNNEAPLQDKKIICKDCGKEFIFSVGEQKFFKEKGFLNDPVRCPECRKAKKLKEIITNKKFRLGIDNFNINSKPLSI